MQPSADSISLISFVQNARIVPKSSSPRNFKQNNQKIDRLDVWIDFCGYESREFSTILLNDDEIDLVLPKNVKIPPQQVLQVLNTPKSEDYLTNIVKGLRSLLRTHHLSTVQPLASKVDKLAFDLSSMEHSEDVDVILCPWDPSTVVIQIPLQDLKGTLTVEYQINGSKIEHVDREIVLDTNPGFDLNSCPKATTDTSLLEYITDVQEWLQEQIEIRQASAGKRKAFVEALIMDLEDLMIEWDKAAYLQASFYFKIDKTNHLCVINMSDTFPIQQPKVTLIDPNNSQRQELKFQLEWKLPMEDVVEDLIQQLYQQLVPQPLNLPASSAWNQPLTTHPSIPPQPSPSPSK